jgi:hypothetical protein
MVGSRELLSLLRGSECLIIVTRASSGIYRMSGSFQSNWMSLSVRRMSSGKRESAILQGVAEVTGSTGSESVSVK